MDGPVPAGGDGFQVVHPEPLLAADLEADRQPALPRVDRAGDPARPRDEVELLDLAGVRVHLPAVGEPDPRHPGAPGRAVLVGGEDSTQT
ncbi:hypothetical protein GCM10025734_18800 [Kitasatospora paranensis]